MLYFGYFIMHFQSQPLVPFRWTAVLVTHFLLLKASELLNGAHTNASTYKKRTYRNDKNHNVSQVVAHPTHHEMTNATQMLSTPLRSIKWPLCAHLIKVWPITVNCGRTGLWMDVLKIPNLQIPMKCIGVSRTQELMHLLSTHLQLTKQITH